ncbi:hypothetical protein niasHS_004057 [Heterodera schachtii]|uniref:CHCH domain-containing protein n=1 Tax=Heterodera schachtii TaxID=97005 RepID=A0ABD2JUJ0_HETSC
MQSPLTSPLAQNAAATPPLKGSFPLDYQQVCHLEMLQYLCCLKEKDGQNSECRDRAFGYFKCRMDNGLMDRDEWPKLGFKDLAEQQQQQQREEEEKAVVATELQR